MVLAFTVLGFLFLAIFIAFYVSTSVQRETALTITYVDGLVALSAAEAGVEQALFYLKRTKESNKILVDALTSQGPLELKLDEPAMREEIAALAPEGGKVDLKLKIGFEPYDDPDVDEIDIDQVHLGRLAIQSQGIYTNPRGGVVKKQVHVVTRVMGSQLLTVAPDHGFFSRDPRIQTYHVPSLTLDARDFSVKGGHVHLENGMDVELTEYMMGKFRSLGEVGFMDLGYDTFNLLTLFNGGVDFTHSREITYTNGGVARRYFQFQGLDALLGGGGPAYLPMMEEYRSVTRDPAIAGNPIVRKASHPPTNDDIRLYDASEYKKIANAKIDPSTPDNPEGNPRDLRFFKTLMFPGPAGLRNTVYENVVPLYGWGNWRRVPPWISPNPSRRQDVSRALNLNGVTYVRGDVFLEGWYYGVGTLVVEGNVYMGGTVLGLPPQITGSPAMLNLIVLEDPAREIFGSDPFMRQTGKVVYKPHHDVDFDALSLNMLRELNPQFDGTVYAKNGMEVDRTSFLDKFFNMEIEFNFVTESFDWHRLPNDLFINGTDPRDIVFGPDTPANQRKAYNPSFSIEIESWEEEASTL